MLYTMLIFQEKNKRKDLLKKLKMFTMKSPQNHYQKAESSFKWNSEVTLREKMILISKFQP